MAAAAGVGNGAIGLRYDVRSSAEVDVATAAAVSALGGLDILVNNAGVEVAAPLLETADSDSGLIFDGVFLTLRYAGRPWRTVAADR